MMERLDITGDIGDLNGSYKARDVAWPMYSFDTPAMHFWNGVANAFVQAGWTEEQIKAWLQSKCARWTMDQHGDKVEQLGEWVGYEIVVKRQNDA